jgi:hypothetical protein
MMVFLLDLQAGFPGLGGPMGAAMGAAYPETHKEVFRETRDYRKHSAEQQSDIGLAPFSYAPQRCG